MNGGEIEEYPAGLSNEGFRYRDLETGTFITRDPIGNTLMMPKEKWVVDGKAVSEQEYEEPLEPGTPQVAAEVIKSAQTTGAESDMHVPNELGIGIAPPSRCLFDVLTQGVRH